MHRVALLSANATQAQNRYPDRPIRLGVDPVTDSNPDKAAAMLKAELDRWRPLIESMKLKN